MKLWGLFQSHIVPVNLVFDRGVNGIADTKKKKKKKKKQVLPHCCFCLASHAATPKRSQDLL